MSSYERRYEVHAHQCSHYTDDPREALRVLDSDPEGGWCNEGYADEEYVPGSTTQIEGTIYTRRTTGTITRTRLLARIAALDYRIHRAHVQHMIEVLRT